MLSGQSTLIFYYLSKITAVVATIVDDKQWRNMLLPLTRKILIPTVALLLALVGHDAWRLLKEGDITRLAIIKNYLELKSETK